MTNPQTPDKLSVILKEFRTLMGQKTTKEGWKINVQTLEDEFTSVYNQGLAEGGTRIINQIEKLCVQYMADANHNLEYNHPTPPIWEYLVTHLKKK